MSTGWVGSYDAVGSLVENWEVIHNESNLKGYAGGKYPSPSPTNAKLNLVIASGDSKGNTAFPMRTITLRG